MISVVILSKTISNLIPCVEAARKHEPETRIVVVDDEIQPGEQESAICKFCFLNMATGVSWVRGEKPFIFSRNANIGLRKAFESSDYAILLNDDALLETPGGFTALVALAEQRPEYGLLAPACNVVGNPNQFRKSGMELREEPRTLCFVGVLIPKRIYKEIGPLCEEFTKYGLDDDAYSLEVRRAGYRLGVFDGCFLDHSSLKSSFRGPAGAGGDFSYNMEVFKRKYGMDNWGIKVSQV